MTNSMVIGVALVTATGGLTYGFDSGIIATTLGQSTFKSYMYGPSLADPTFSGAIVSAYNAGQAIGSMSVSYLADRFSRKYTISVAGALAVVGGVLQAAAVSAPMLIVGRLIAGISCGILLSTVPIYIAEVAPAGQRGFLVGLQGMMIAIGFGLANWIGYAGSFAKDDAQWRMPLAMQIPVPIFLAVAAIFIPFSPRWLVMQERYEEAKAILLRLHETPDQQLAEQEMIEIRDQVQIERDGANMSWSMALQAMFSVCYLRRTLTATFIIAMGQLSGSSVIQNFQSIFYATIGFTGQTALLISGVYGMMGIFGQIFYLLVVADKWPRSRTLWIGSLVLSIMIGICMALSAAYGTVGADQNGARAAIAFIFLYSFFYAIFFNAMIWVVPSELFPLFLRSKGLSFAVAVKAIFAIVLSQITPVALAAISWRYYSLFIATNFTAALIYFFYLPETGGKTLEEIAELFGEAVVHNDTNIELRKNGAVEHREAI